MIKGNQKTTPVQMYEARTCLPGKMSPGVCNLHGEQTHLSVHLHALTDFLLQAGELSLHAVQLPGGCLLQSLGGACPLLGCSRSCCFAGNVLLQSGQRFFCLRLQF